jgi:hypothetical protein
MLFLEALAQMEMGMAMHRASWTIESGYLKLMEGMDFVWKIVLLPNPNAGNYIFSVEDFLADDWQEFKAPKKEEIEVLKEKKEG